MSGYETKDSGKREEYATGSLRDTTEGKGSYISLSPHALRRWALLMERGARKYGFGNWMLGQPFSRLFDSAMRHLLQARSGDKSEDHLAAVIFNVAAIIHFEEEIAAGRLPAELDDLPRLEHRAGRASAPAFTVASVPPQHKADCEAFAKAMACPLATAAPPLKQGKWVCRDGHITDLAPYGVWLETSEGWCVEASQWHGDGYQLFGKDCLHADDLIRPAVLATIAHEFEVSAPSPMTDCPSAAKTLPRRFRENDCGA